MATKRAGTKQAPKPAEADADVVHLPPVVLPGHGPQTNAEMYLVAILTTMGAVLAELRAIREDLKPPKS